MVSNVLDIIHKNKTISFVLLVIFLAQTHLYSDNLSKKNDSEIQTCINSDGQYINKKCYKKMRSSQYQSD